MVHMKIKGFLICLNSRSLIYIHIMLMYINIIDIMYLISMEVIFMSISYNKLWKILIDRNMNKTQLRLLAKISTNAIAKLGRNESVSMETMDKICKALNCNIGDVMEFVVDEDNKN